MSAVERSWDALFLLRMDGDLSNIMADEDMILEYHGFKKSFRCWTYQWW